MKKLLLWLFIIAVIFAQSEALCQRDWTGWKFQLDAVDVINDTTYFDTNLSVTDTDLQTALETLDELSTGHTQEEIDDYIDALINDTDSVHTGITITYDDTDNAMDFVVTGTGWTDGDPNPYVTDITDSAGIGTVAPSEVLHVVGNVQLGLSGGSTQRLLKFSDHYADPTANANKIQLHGTTYGFGVSINDLDYTSDGNHRFHYGTSEKFAILSSGRVGIGTSVPAYGLDVVHADGVGIGTTTAADALVVYTDGNVGIGSVVPIGKLDINGSIAISGVLGGDNEVIKMNGTTMNWEADAGGAAGGATYREITFLPHSCGIGTTNPAVIDWVNSTGTGFARFPRAKFDDGEDDTLHFGFTMPSDATASADWILDIEWYSDEDVAEDVVWAVQVSATTADDADNLHEQAADTADTVTDSADASEALALIKVSLTIDYANCDGAVADDTVELIFYRDGDNGSDNHTNECYLYKLHLKIPRS